MLGGCNRGLPASKRSVGHLPLLRKHRFDLSLLQLPNPPLELGELLLERRRTLLGLI